MASIQDSRLDISRNSSRAAEQTNAPANQDSRLQKTAFDSSAYMAYADASTDTQEKKLEKAVFDHTAFMAWAKGPSNTQETQEKKLEKAVFDSAAFMAWAKGPSQENPPLENIKQPNTSPFRLRTF